jgi:hypothetical protein
MDNAEYLKSILPQLSVPIAYKWRVQSYAKNGTPQATCVAYIDSRDVMDRLDKVCIYGWERSHISIKDNIYASVRIIMPDGSSISRMDCGTESSTEKEKGESSDSFKRAAVNWGVGRFLYDLEIKRLPANELKTNTNYPYVVDDKGKKVWDITKHINSATYEPKTQAPKEPSNATVGDAEFKVLQDFIEETNTDKVAFCAHFKIASVSALPLAKYASAIAMLKKKLNSIPQPDTAETQA